MGNRVIVVDDDHSILELLRILLEGEDYQVQAFDSAAAALKAALDRPPDAAIIDLMMPGMTGLDLLQALRYDSRTVHLPVVICSAYYGELRRQTAELGQNNTACIRKPFRLQDLLDKLGEMLANSHQEISRNGRGDVGTGQQGDGETRGPAPRSRMTGRGWKTGS